MCLYKLHSFLNHIHHGNFYSTTLLAPSNISYKGHVKSSLQADLSEGEKVQGSLILRSCVVDELQSAKEIYHCTNNLEKEEGGRLRREGHREERRRGKTGGAREGKMEECRTSQERGK